MADKLYGDIIYEDKYIMVSHEVIASKKVRYNLAYRWDVYLITYVYRSMRYGKLEYYCMHTGNPENDVHIYLNGYKTGSSVIAQMRCMVIWMAPEAIILKK